MPVGKTCSNHEQKDLFVNLTIKTLVTAKMKAVTYLALGRCRSACVYWRNHQNNKICYLV